MGISTIWGDYNEICWYDSIIDITRLGETMKPIIAANWKMNLTQIEATNLLNDLSSVIESYDFDIILCPSACYLNLLKQELIIAFSTLSPFILSWFAQSTIRILFFVAIPINTTRAI